MKTEAQLRAAYADMIDAIRAAEGNPLVRLNPHLVDMLIHYADALCYVLDDTTPYGNLKGGSFTILLDNLRSIRVREGDL